MQAKELLMGQMIVKQWQQSVEQQRTISLFLSKDESHC